MSGVLADRIGGWPVDRQATLVIIDLVEVVHSRIGVGSGGFDMDSEPVLRVIACLCLMPATICSNIGSAAD